MRLTLYNYSMKYGKSYLLNQWHPEKNLLLTPQDVTYGSHQNVWWCCSKGHTWQAAVYSRTNGGNGCPYCAGQQVLPGKNDLASHRPDIATQWHPTKNGSRTPLDVAVGSHKAVWWLCKNGHEYIASVKARTKNGSGCPICAGKKVLAGFNDLATENPVVAAQWHPTLNGTFTPQQVTTGSHRRVWWQCSSGHVWKATVYSRTGNQQYGCPVCAGKFRQVT